MLSSGGGDRTIGFLKGFVSNFNGIGLLLPLFGCGFSELFGNGNSDSSSFDESLLASGEFGGEKSLSRLELRRRF